MAVACGLSTRGRRETRRSPDDQAGIARNVRKEIELSSVTPASRKVDRFPASKAAVSLCRVKFPRSRESATITTYRLHLANVLARIEREIGDRAAVVKISSLQKIPCRLVNLSSVM